MNPAHIPVILFVLEEDLTISFMSNLAKDLLPCMHLEDIIDPDSYSKWKSYTTNRKPRTGEIHLTKGDELVPCLYKINYSYSVPEKKHYIVFTESQDDIKKIRFQMHELRQQLVDSNYEKIKTSERKQWISMLEPFLSTIDISSLLVEEKRIDLAIEKLQRMEDLLSTIRPDMIELGKWETVDLITQELHEIRSIVTYYQTLLNLPDIS